ncbi:MAG: redox-sensing transcriptional repressor Rex [Ardenticatenaceae bacterium]|nr:redox-sensing transcriptional repressor Rex [Ardenticatenaceae bacterium]
MVASHIPDIVIGRLPIYLRELTRLAEEDQKITTSSHELGKRLGISSAQIRKDLSHFGEFGKQGTGYHINYLVDQLRDILHLDRQWDVALIGAGYLGHALIHYDGFLRHGFRITCIFDNNPAKIGDQISGLTIQHIDEMPSTIQDQGIEIAILVVPALAAQEITNCLVKVGIKSILTYAPIHLDVPEDVQVSYSDPVVQLQRMTFYLSP